MSNKIAIITGASRGLGKNTALHLASRGTDIILTYHSRKEEAEAVVAEVEQSGRKAAALQLNTGNSASFPAFASAVKALLANQWQRDSANYLVNNAGFGTLGSFAEQVYAVRAYSAQVPLTVSLFVTFLRESFAQGFQQKVLAA